MTLDMTPPKKQRYLKKPISIRRKDELLRMALDVLESVATPEPVGLFTKVQASSVADRIDANLRGEDEFEGGIIGR